MMNTALVIPVRLFGRWEGFLHSWGCFRFFLMALLLCSPAVVYADWGPDVRLTYNASFSMLCSNNARAIAVDSLGGIHVVWYDFSDNDRGEIYYKRSTDWGNSWGPDVRLTLDTALSWWPAVDADKLGRVHVGWSDRRNGPFWEAYYKRSTDRGVSWGPDVRLSDQTQKMYFDTIGSDNLGWVHVVGSSYLGVPFGHQLWYRRSRDGGVTWDPWVLLRDSLYGADPSSMAIGSGQDIHIVSDQLHYLRSTDGGTTWSRDTALANTLLPYIYIPCVSVDRENRVHIVWFDQRGGGDSLELFYKRSTDGGSTWEPDFKLTHSDSGQPDNQPVIAGDSTGIVHVLYEVSTHGTFYKQSTDAGLTWAPPYHLLASGLAPHVVVDSRENAHVVYVDVPPGGSSGEIYYKQWMSSQGVEEYAVTSPNSRFPFSVRPNPFTSFARSPGHSSERFSLYDISGRKVGVYRGDRIGSGLSAGVYFLRPQEGKAKPLRVVKVR